MIEMKDRNIKLTKDHFLKGKTPIELATEYKTSVSNIRRIITDTKIKYPELITNS